MNRVLFVVTSVDLDQLQQVKALVEQRDDLRSLPIRRPSIYDPTTTVATAMTGVDPFRHEVHTLLVPRPEAGADEAETPEPPETSDAGPSRLQFRTSRMAGAPFIWNRLASRGISSLVVNLPLTPAQDDDRVAEVPTAVVNRVMTQRGIEPLETILGILRGGIDQRPETGCAIVRLSNPNSGDSSDEADESDDLDDLGEEEAGESVEASERGAEILEQLDRLGDAAGASRSLALILGPRGGIAVLKGVDPAARTRSYSLLHSGPSTLLDLFGEPMPADLSARSMLVADDAGPETGRRPAASWTVDGGVAEAPDWSVAIERALAGELSDLGRSAVLRHLWRRLLVLERDNRLRKAVELLSELDRLGAGPSVLLKQAQFFCGLQEAEEFRRVVERLRSEHPDSPEADLVGLVPCADTDPATVGEILDRHPVDSQKDETMLRICCRAAARADRAEEAISGLWRIIAAGRATSQDRMQFANLAMQRQEGQDAARAALVLRDLGGPNATDAKGQPQARITLLRARALAASGSLKPAIRLLEAFLARNGADQKVEGLLESLRAGAVGGSDSS